MSIPVYYPPQSSVKGAVLSNGANIQTIRHLLWLRDRPDALTGETPPQLTAAQRTALGILSHVFALPGSTPTNVHTSLAGLRRYLSLSEHLSTTALALGKQIPPNVLQCENFFDPPAQLVDWIERATERTLSEGVAVSKRRVPNLRPQEYEHPFDRKALDSIAGTPGVETAVRAAWSASLEAFDNVNHTGSYMRVTERSMPHVVHAAQTAAEVLEIDLPEIYANPGFINAFTVCPTRPIIVITAGAPSLQYNELVFMLGHEMGHIKSEHVMYHSLGRRTELLNHLSLGLAKPAVLAVRTALDYWARRSEFTADRAGLLACQDRDASIRALMKMAGYPPRFYKSVDPEQLLEQAQAFKAMDENTAYRFAKYAAVLDEDHPWSVLRAAELQEWFDSGGYFDVLNRNTSQARE